MKQWASLLTVLVLMVAQSPWGTEVRAQLSSEHHPISVAPGTTNNPHVEHAKRGWEGSSEGIAYSEFNHHFAGLCDVLFGLAELGYALRLPLPFWIRLILPGALGLIGAFLLVWSDHDAWPIGSLGFVETFFGQDREIIEHKFYGVLAVAIALCETFRRIGWARHRIWAAPLVLLTLVGGLLLFVHSHGNHPASARIEFHHALLGSVALGAALSKGLASWLPRTSRHAVKRWEIAWAGSVIVFGLLLLVYSE